MNGVQKNKADVAVPKRPPRSLLMRIVIGFFAFIFSCVVLVQLALFGVIGWVNSQSGQEWLGAQIDTSLQGTGYKIDFDGLRYSFPTSVSLRGIEIADAKGVFAEAKDVRLHLDIMPMAARTISFSLDVESLRQIRAPVDDAPKNNEGLFAPVILQSFAMPEGLYFNKIRTDGISIKNLVLAGQDKAAFSPVLSGELGFGDESIRMNFDFAAGDNYPDLHFEGAFKPALVLLEVQSIAITQDNLAVLAKGLIDFGGQGKGALKIDVKMPELKDALIGLDYAYQDKGIVGTLLMEGGFEGQAISANLPFTLHGDEVTMRGISIDGGSSLALGGDVMLRPLEQFLDVNLSKIEGAGVGLDRVRAKINRSDDGVLNVDLGASGILERPIDIGAQMQINPQAQAIETMAASIDFGDASLKIDGKADLQNIDMTLRAKEFPLSRVMVDAPDVLARMDVSGQVHLSGAPSSPILESELAFSPMQIYDGVDAQITLRSAYREGNVNIALNGKASGLKTFEGAFDAPLRLSFYPFETDLGAQTPVRGALKIAGDAKSLAGSFLPPDQSFSGNLDAVMEVGATLFAPQITAQVKLAGGTYRHKTHGMAIRDLNIAARVADGKMTLDRFDGTDGAEGKLSARGFMLLNGGEMDLSLSAAQMALLNGDMAKGVFDADLNLEMRGGMYFIGGQIAPRRVEVNIPQSYATSVPALNIVKSQDAGKSQRAVGDTINLDVRVNAPERIFVRGWGLDAEFGGMLDIKGKLSEPQFDGMLKSIRGRYSEFGKNFEIARADMKFSGTIPPNPVMDILAQIKSDDVTAQVGITGSLIKPAFAFSAVPAVPEDEVLSYILFGRNMSNISPFQAAQLAQTLQRFSGQGGGGLNFDPLAIARGITGLDDIRVDTSEEGGASVGAGKYLSDKVYLEFEAGAQGAGGANLQIELTPSINIESKIGQDAQGGAGIFWSKDY